MVQLTLTEEELQILHDLCYTEAYSTISIEQGDMPVQKLYFKILQLKQENN